MIKEAAPGMLVDIVLTTGEKMKRKRIAKIEKVLDKRYFIFKTRDKWAKIIGNGGYGEDRIVSMTPSR